MRQRLFEAVNLLGGKPFDLLRDLVKTRSYPHQEGVSNDPGTVAGKIYRVLKSVQGLEVFPQEVEFPDGGRSENIIAVLRGRSDKKALVINAHMDTVSEGDPLAWHDSQPFSGNEGVVKYLGNKDILVEVCGKSYEGKIRPKMAEIWERRGDNVKEIIYGRGAYDNKGGLVSAIFSMIVLSQILRKEDTALEGDLILACTVDEEDSGRGTMALVEWLRSNEYLKGILPKGNIRDNVFGVVIEGSYAFKAIVGHRGGFTYSLKTRGKATHAATPELGENAVEKMCRILSYLYENRSLLEERLGRLAPDPILERPTAAFGTTIAGGDINRVEKDEKGIRVIRRSANMIPDWCEATVDIRIGRGLNHPKDLDDMPGKIRELLVDFVHERTEYKDLAVSTVDYFSPVAILSTFDEANSVEIVRRALDAAEEVLGYRTGVDTVPGGTDAYTMIYMGGINTLVEFGPAGGLHHECHEYVEKDQVLDGVKILALLAYEFLAPTGSS